MLLAYQVPNQPTAGRVYIWRKLKKLGAVLLHDALWVLPATTQTREQLRWLAAEVVELKGQATVWESALMTGDEDWLIKQFNASVEPEYRKLLSTIRKKNPDLSAASRRYQQLRTQDYFDCKVGQQVRERLMKAKGGGQ
jgi:hypothetical protein